MAKKTLRPDRALYPCPVVLVSVADSKGRLNFMTASWCGIVCSNPPLISVSIRPKRLTGEMIKEAREFVINIPRASLVKEVDLAGILSGRNIDKFKRLNFTAVSASKVKSPVIKECPVNIECKLVEVKPLGSHDMFIAEVLSVQADEELLDKEDRIDYKRADPFVYNQGEYFGLSEKIGHYGFSKEDSYIK